MNKLLYFILTLFVISCKGQDCKFLKEDFKTYNKAQSVILSTNFAVEDSVNTSSSSWIKNANYFSCNNKFGYLILETSSKKYIFKEVPVKIWNEFKKADSFGRFYNQKIRSKYQFILNK